MIGYYRDPLNANLIASRLHKTIDEMDVGDSSHNPRDVLLKFFNLSRLIYLMVVINSSRFS